MRKAFEGGITFFDTARAYTDSEEKIGAALASCRKGLIIAFKSGTNNKKQLLEHIEKSLLAR